jgi:hypothetical protein
MDNSLDIPGYKYYRRSDDGSRPEVFVAFVDIVEDAAATTGGALIAVDDALLRALDARERNYERVDVSARVADRPPGATIWTYRGSAAGRARLALGRQRGNAVVAVDYVQAIRAALRVLGFADADVDPRPLALVWLDRIEIPPAAPA